MCGDRRVETHRRVGQHDREDEHSTDCVCRRARDGTLRFKPHPQLLVFLAVFLLVLFYLAYRTIGWALAKWGTGWGILELKDWASLPVLLLLLSVFSFIAGPIGSAVSRHFEHQADQYGLEVTSRAHTRRGSGGGTGVSSPRRSGSFQTRNRIRWTYSFSIRTRRYPTGSNSPCTTIPGTKASSRNS